MRRKETVFLGFVIDSVKIKITLTDKSKKYIYALSQNILFNSQATIKELAQTMKLTVFSFRAVPCNQTYYRKLEKCKYKPWPDVTAILIKKAEILGAAAVD